MMTAEQCAQISIAAARRRKRQVIMSPGVLFDRLLFGAGRRRTFELLQLRDMERVLLMGIGTGTDLTYLPQEIQAVRLDLSPEMLLKAKKKLSGNWKQVSCAGVVGSQVKYQNRSESCSPSSPACARCR